jgi:hypothetical protein
LQIIHEFIFNSYVWSQNCRRLLLFSSCLPVRIPQLWSHWMEFHEIWYVFFENLPRKFKSQ